MTHDPWLGLFEPFPISYRHSSNYCLIPGFVKFLESGGVHGAAAEGDDEEEDEDDDLGHDEL